MFKIGDYIIYGSNGVCEVEDVGTIDNPSISKDKLYYTLSPYYTKGSRIFTPADNSKVIMRLILTKKEAMKLIDEIEDIDSLGILDEKRKELEYKEAFRKGDCRQLVKIIKAIYLRRQSRIAEGKKITSVDDKYFHMAEENLYGELAVSLDMDKDMVKDFIIKHVGEEKSMI